MPTEFMVDDLVYNNLVDHANHGVALVDEEKALLLLGAIERELARGTLHFHPITDEPLTTVSEVLSVLKAYGSITIQAGGVVAEVAVVVGAAETEDADAWDA